MIILSGFLLGLSNTFACLGVCAPVLFPFLLAEQKKPGLPLALFIGGRLVAYLLFAVLSGVAGIYFEGRLHPRYFALLTILLALWLIAYSLGKLRFEAGVCRLLGQRFSGALFPLFAGLVMGANLCPPFLLGLNEALQMNSILLPVLFFAGFYIGSSLWMAVLLFTGKLVQKDEARSIGRLASLLVGVWYLVQGITAFL